MTKAVVFDIGGVLIGLDMDRCIRAFREGMGFERITELLDPCHQKGIYGEMEEGKVSAREFCDYILRESRPGCTAQDVKNCIGALLKGMEPDAVETLQRLAARYPLYLLSNNNPIAMELINQEFLRNGIHPEVLFRGQFISYEMKLMKPSAQIFGEVIRGIGEPAGEIVFVDDSLLNVEAARAQGIDARLFKGDVPLSRLLQDLL